MRISDWSSDVCSSDLGRAAVVTVAHRGGIAGGGGIVMPIITFARCRRRGRGRGPRPVVAAVAVVGITRIGLAVAARVGRTACLVVAAVLERGGGGIADGLGRGQIGRESCRARV